MRLMDIDTDRFGTPDTEYDAPTTMPAAEIYLSCWQSLATRSK